MAEDTEKDADKDIVGRPPPERFYDGCVVTVGGKVVTDTEADFYDAPSLKPSHPRDWAATLPALPEFADEGDEGEDEDEDGDEGEDGAA